MLFNKSSKYLNSDALQIVEKNVYYVSVLSRVNTFKFWTVTLAHVRKARESILVR